MNGSAVHYFFTMIKDQAKTLVFLKKTFLHFWGDGKAAYFD